MTFWEANIMFPKTYEHANESRDEEYNVNRNNNKDFPELVSSSKGFNDNEITSSQRRVHEFQNNIIKTKRTYAVVSQINNNKRSKKSGYEKQAHENSLIFPNSRPQKKNEN